MSQTSQTSRLQGNTKQPRNRSRNWCFTFNNYTEENIISLIDYFKINKYNYVFQEEIGEEKTKHLQGLIMSQTQISFNTLKNFNDKIHWEKCKKIKNSIDYCTKLQSRNGKVYTNIDIEIEEDPMEGLELNDWQIEIMNILKEKPDKRKIYWYVDKIGGKGKTTFSKWLILKNKKNNTYLTSSKCSDIKYSIASHIKTHKKLKCVIFDYARTNEGYISYEAIEVVKNGIFFSNKYESSMCTFNVPHIIIFANFEPDIYKLSQDRWIIKHI